MTTRVATTGRSWRPSGRRSPEPAAASVGGGVICQVGTGHERCRNQVLGRYVEAVEVVARSRGDLPGERLQYLAGHWFGHGWHSTIRRAKI